MLYMSHIYVTYLAMTFTKGPSILIHSFFSAHKISADPLYVRSVETFLSAEIMNRLLPNGFRYFSD